MKTKLNTLLLFVSFTGAALAAPQQFDFKDPKGVNNVVFRTDAIIESINGQASGITGTVTFDPENPGATKGKIVVATASMHVPNSMMQGHMQGPDWLDSAKHAEISFEVKELKNAKTDEKGMTKADATGTFTLKGVSKEITVPVTLTYLKDKLGQRVPNMKGDLLVIRSDFTIKRSDYAVNPGQGEDKVSDEVHLSLSIAGAAKK